MTGSTSVIYLPMDDCSLHADIKLPAANTPLIHILHLQMMAKTQLLIIAHCLQIFFDKFD